MQDSTIDTEILDLMLRAGSRWVLWLLIALSLGALAVIIERIWFFIQERRPEAQIKKAVEALHQGSPEAALKALAGARSMEAIVLRSCIARAAEGPEAVDEHRAAIVELERQRYEKRLAFLGTLGNNAPFIGLFGTVLGIIRAFHDLAGSTLQGTSAVMSGIAEALVATGVGLLVALPAVAAYNAFTRHVEASANAADAAAHEVLAFLKKKAP
ncbi:MAG: MotA/TolQ/ExbB proton channel family protein [Kofleriaceae bacterium]